LDTLPALSLDSDDGIIEAQRRYDEMDLDPIVGINLKQFDQLIAQRK